MFYLVCIKVHDHHFSDAFKVLEHELEGGREESGQVEGGDGFFTNLDSKSNVSVSTKPPSLITGAVVEPSTWVCVCVCVRVCEESMVSVGEMHL